MITPGLLSSLRTLHEILCSGNTKEAKLFLESLVTAVQEAHEHDLVREALIRADVLMGLIQSASEDSPEEEQFDNEVAQTRQLIMKARTIRGLLP